MDPVINIHVAFKCSLSLASCLPLFHFAYSRCMDFDLFKIVHRVDDVYLNILYYTTITMYYYVLLCTIQSHGQYNRVMLHPLLRATHAFYTRPTPQYYRILARQVNRIIRVDLVFSTQPWLCVKLIVQRLIEYRKWK